MKTSAYGNIGWMIAGLLAVGGLLSAAGCKSATSPQPAPVSAQAPDAPAPAQPVFDTDEEAVNAMLTAVKAQDHDQVHLLLGPAWKELISGDKIEDANAFKEFAQRAAERTRLQRQ